MNYADEQRINKAFNAVIQRNPYRTRKGYPHWNTVVKCYIYGGMGMISAGDKETAEFLSDAFDLSMSQVYEVETDLLRQFQTDKSLNRSVLEGINIDETACLFVFPQNSIFDENMDGPVIWSLFGYLPKDATVEKDKDHAFNIVSTGGGIHVYKDESFRGNVSMLNNTVFQLWLYSMFGHPEPIEKDSSANRHQKTRTSKAPKYWTPKRLALTKTIYRKNHRHSGTHASPRTHIRSSHWRNQAKGKGRTERELLWIPPTVING